MSTAVKDYQFLTSEAINPIDMASCARAAEMLEKHYPGWAWAVNISGGVMNVHSLKLSGTWGFRIKLKDLDPAYHKVLLAGGEVLERYNKRRGRFDIDLHGVDPGKPDV